MASASPPRRLPREQRSEQLLDVAEALFVEHGYDRTSIEEVARAAGVTRPVVYEHHGSKEGLYIACVKRARDRFAAELVDALAGVEDPEAQIRIAGDLLFRMIERDPQRWVVLFGSSAVPMIGELGERLTSLRGETIARIAALIRVAAPHADRELADAFAHAVAGVGDQLGRWWIRNPHVPRERAVGHYTEFIWSGLRPLVGAA